MARTVPSDPINAIRHLYFQTSRQTIQRDLTRAIELLKQLASDEERERAAVYMDGLSQMRSEWTGGAQDEDPAERPRHKAAPPARGKKR